jgi:hypothetical protein
MSEMINWENGSEFHWIEENGINQNDVFDFSYSLFGSGRDAIVSLLHWGVPKNNWERIFVPFYFCPDVILAIKKIKLEIIFYFDSPIDNDNSSLENINFKRNDLLLRVNYFGVRKPRSNKWLKEKGVIIIEDHTYDPWSQWAKESDANWCFASLRKVLPIPDGGVLWSPNHAVLPSAELTPEHLYASNKKLLAMFLKNQYLKGIIQDKEIYRKLFIEGENNVYGSELSAISNISRSLLIRFPIDKMRMIKLANYRILASSVRTNNLRILEPEYIDAIPFSFIILLRNSELRNELAKHLISNNIYPAILWRLDHYSDIEIPSKYLNLSESILSIHCDFRYDENDIKKIANTINNFISDKSTEYISNTV